MSQLDQGCSRTARDLDCHFKGIHIAHNGIAAGSTSNGSTAELRCCLPQQKMRLVEV